MVTREILHHLIDTLPEPSLSRVEHLLVQVKAEEEALPAVLRDAPLDDPEEDELAALADVDLTEPGLSTEELRRELGL